MSADATTRHHGPGHAHGSRGHQHTDIDWEAMADTLENAGDLRVPVLRATAARLRELLAPGHEVRRVLDVGSGPGVMACVLAEEFAGAEAVAVDGTPALLDRTLARARRLGLDGRVGVRHADLSEGLDEGPGTADLVWSSMAVHHLGDQQGALDTLAGVLRPGGVLAVAEAVLPTRFLPRDIGLGKPGLQPRLDALQEEWFALMRTELPGYVAASDDWPAMLTRAGLTGVTAFTTLLDIPAPLPAPARGYLRDFLTRLRESMSESLPAEDRRTLDTLLDPSSPQGIAHRSDAFLLAPTTVFAGVRPAA
ncbi:class I SAM-dependent methyltransferase [Actinacidiphila paucisporea]|uniref:Methyltransferase domain-containing protein n=1 Tax=Actinacidiphila paucisporea TaxID=310782 RepID=A0A1M6Z734_9ACTN|nr:class I SAM-dependent methyltransferase [Actinacidiphila paucisporea]SHL26257.1 Methyltransferase domain-containing protein [Actinacidiphila paucisporea]